MEVRCGSCNKLFRVSNDKITGKGIKFTCTRCGEFVKITREAFENYMLAQPAVSELDMLEPKASPPVERVPEPEAAPAAATAVLAPTGVNAGVEETIGLELKTDELSSPFTPDFLQEREETPSPEPSPFEDSAQTTELQPPHEHAFPSEPEPAQEEMRAEPEIEPAPPVKPEAPQEAIIAAEPKKEPAPEPERSEKAPPESVVKSAPMREPTLEQKTDAKPETSAGLRAAAGPAVQARPATTVVPVTAGVSTAAPKKEPVRQTGTMPPKTVKGTVPAVAVRSGNLVTILLVALVILGLGGGGVYLYMRSSPSAKQESRAGMVSVEGLQLVNPVGSLSENGDLMISGEVENTTDRPQADWYIVVEVLDASGAVLHRIRMLDGKQIYTRNDYEILTNRGANVQELKEKALQPHGVVLPPKGKTAFEIRYLQPPAGIASFNAALQPFDPARLLKEIAEETK